MPELVAKTILIAIAIAIVIVGRWFYPEARSKQFRLLPFSVIVGLIVAYFYAMLYTGQYNLPFVVLFVFAIAIGVATSSELRSDK